MTSYPYVLTVSSEKGGVGKTTLATNLAIFLKALDEDLPVSILSFDNHYTVDRMFEIKGQPLKGDVADFLQGTTGIDLIQTGQYGVNYIPSSKKLGTLKSSIVNPLVLSRLISASRIPGILIIDTRPDLDILTQNALFAADRVIIPVKDMASLENCRNIFELFETKGFDKKALSLIPCIIDSRIKFDSPFRDQRSLLKAYAINRGYRCMDTYISKSPKVESLGTNPSGKIYPILTYARHTEVYNQFVQLAKTVLDEFRTSGYPRSLFFHQWLIAEQERSNAEYNARLSGLRKDCVCCGRPISTGNPGSVGYYFETSDSSDYGFLDDSCFSGLLVSSVYNLGTNLTADDPRFLMFKDATRDSSFTFRQSGKRDGSMVELTRFDDRGILLSRKLYPLREHEGGILRREQSRLYTLVTETLAGKEGTSGGIFLLVHPVDPDGPDKMLEEENYRAFRALKNRITEQMAIPAST